MTDNIYYKIHYKGIWGGPKAGYHVSMNGGETVIIKRWDHIIDDLKTMYGFRVKFDQLCLTEKELEQVESLGLDLIILNDNRKKS